MAFKFADAPFQLSKAVYARQTLWLVTACPRTTAILFAYQAAVLGVQATRTGDPLVIRQAQANIAARRAGLRTPLGATPAAAGTPGFTSMLRTPAGFARTPMATPTLTPRGADGDPLDRCVNTGGCCEGYPQALVLLVLFFLTCSGSPLVLVLYLGQVIQPCCVIALYTHAFPLLPQSWGGFSCAAVRPVPHQAAVTFCQR